MDLKLTLRSTSIMGPCRLELPILHLDPTLFDLLSMNHQMTKVHVVMKNFSPKILHMIIGHTPITKQLISSLELDTKEEAYMDNLMNFKEYS